DSTQMQATFDLRGLATGAYAIEVIDGAQTATSGFTVNNGAAGQLTLSRLELPQALRPGQNGVVTLQYANTGNTDIPAPIIAMDVMRAVNERERYTKHLALAGNGEFRTTKLDQSGQWKDNPQEHIAAVISRLLCPWTN